MFKTKGLAYKVATASNKPHLNTRKDKESPTVEELWGTLATLATRVVEDNKNCLEYYPKAIRDNQLETMRRLVSEIQRIHNGR